MVLMNYFRFYVGHITEEGRDIPDAPTKIREIVGRYFKAATIIQTQGLWEGQTEPSSIIDVFVDAGEVSRRKVRGLSKDLDIELKQQTVMVVTMPTVAVKFTSYD